MAPQKDPHLGFGYLIECHQHERCRLIIGARRFRQATEHLTHTILSRFKMVIIVTVKDVIEVDSKS